MLKTPVLTITPCPVLANNLRSSLQSWGYEFLGNLENLEDNATLASTSVQPAIALLDEVLLDEQGNDPRFLKTVLPSDMRFLILAKTLTHQMKLDILRRGAHGYVMISHYTKFLNKAIDELALGGVWAERHVLLGIILEHRSHVFHARDTDYSPARKYFIGTNPIHGLTDRERTVVKFVGYGLRNKEIARKLDISETTVRLHLNRIYRKLGVTSRLQLGLLLGDVSSTQDANY